MAMPRSAIIWTRSRELSLNVRYHRTHRTIISGQKPFPEEIMEQAGSEASCLNIVSRDSWKNVQIFVVEINN